MVGGLWRGLGHEDARPLRVPARDAGHLRRRRPQAPEPRGLGRGPHPRPGRRRRRRHRRHRLPVGALPRPLVRDPHASPVRLVLPARRGGEHHPLRLSRASSPTRSRSASARTTTSCAALLRARAGAGGDDRPAPPRRAPRRCEIFSARAARRAVLDIGLPDADGRDVCQALRARGVTTPVLFLTARDAVTERVSGFNAGGDDYLDQAVRARPSCWCGCRALLRRGRAERPAAPDPPAFVLDPGRARAAPRRPRRRRSPRRSSASSPRWPAAPGDVVRHADAHRRRLARRRGRARQHARRLPRADPPQAARGRIGRADRHGAQRRATGCGDVPRRGCCSSSLLTLAVGLGALLAGRQRRSSRARADVGASAACCGPAPRPRSLRSPSRRGRVAVRESANDGVLDRERLGARRRPRRSSGPPACRPASTAPRCALGRAGGAERVVGRATSTAARRAGPRPAHGARSARSSSASSIESARAPPAASCCSVRSCSPRCSCSRAGWTLRGAVDGALRPVAQMTPRRRGLERERPRPALRARPAARRADRARGDARRPARRGSRRHAATSSASPPRSRTSCAPRSRAARARRAGAARRRPGGDAERAQALEPSSTTPTGCTARDRRAARRRAAASSTPARSAVDLAALAREVDDVAIRCAAGAAAAARATPTCPAGARAARRERPPPRPRAASSSALERVGRPRPRRRPRRRPRARPELGERAFDPGVRGQATTATAPGSGLAAGAAAGALVRRRRALGPGPGGCFVLELPAVGPATDQVAVRSPVHPGAP